MKKLLIYIAAFAMILAMNTSCEDMGSLTGEYGRGNMDTQPDYSICL